MNRLLFLVFLFFAPLAHTQEPSEIKREIDSLFASSNGDFALAFKNLESGEEILINAKEQFHAASTMKTPVMIELFKQAEQGKFSLQDSVIVKNEFRSIVSGAPFSLDIGRDSGDSLYEKIGERTPISALVTDMIIHSSNLATNQLIELVDAKKVTETMRELGAEDILVLRGVEDIEAFDAGLNNTTTAHDLMLMFEALAEGRAVSESASEKMIDVLLLQHHKDIIPARLPDTVKVAHKTGSITGVRHDSGIVYLPTGETYVLVLLSKNMEAPEEGIKMMAGVSRLLYDWVAGEK